MKKPIQSEGEAMSKITAGDMMVIANDAECLVRTVWHAVNSPNFDESDYDSIGNVLYMALASIECLHKTLRDLNDQDIFAEANALKGAAK